MADGSNTDGRVLGPDSCVTTPRPDEKCRNPVAVSMTSTVFMHLSPLFPSGQSAIQCKTKTYARLSRLDGRALTMGSLSSK